MNKKSKKYILHTIRLNTGFDNKGGWGKPINPTGCGTVMPPEAMSKLFLSVLFSTSINKASWPSIITYNVTIKSDIDNAFIL